MKYYALIVNSLQEMRSKATLIVLAGISTLLLIGVMFSISSVESADGISLLVFGNPVAPPSTLEGIETVVRGIQSGMAKGLFFGILLFGVIATAGLVPTMLQRGTVDLHLSKPIARWELLFGKMMGGVFVIFVNVLYFIGGLWIVFGMKLGVWNSHLLLSVVSITYVFACLYSLVLLVGVISRGVVLPIIAAFIYIVFVGGLLEQRESSLYLLSENYLYRLGIDGLYYLMPQLSAMQESIINHILHQEPVWISFAYSSGASILLFIAASFFFSRQDY